MNRRNVIAVCSVLLTALVISGWLAVRSNGEPRFKGKKLSEWINKYITEDRFGTAEARQQTQQAVRAIGTNALPSLLLWIRQEDGQVRQRAFRTIQRLGMSKVDLRRALRQRSLAWFGFRLLGPDASPAVPELTRLLENDAAAMDLGTNRMTVAESAVFALGEIGAAAVPALTQALTNHNVNVRKHAAQKLGELGREARESIPALVGALSDNDGSVRIRATRSLRQIHANPEIVVPALVNGLSDNWDLRRKDTALALAAFGPQAELAVPRLRQVASNNGEEPMVRKAAQGALTAISGGPGSKD